MSGAVLWIHVLSGAVWILSALCLALAGVALGAEGEEAREFIQAVVPRLNRIDVGAAVLVLGSGIANLWTAAAQREYRFSTAFRAILGFKIGLFILMLVLLAATIGVHRAMLRDGPSAFRPGLYRLAGLAFGVALLGGAALSLGLWLVGA